MSWIIFAIHGADFRALNAQIYFGIGFMPVFSIILVIGLLNDFACYCQWKSQAISLSKSATMGIPDDIIALTLVLTLTPGLENPYLTNGLVFGVILCFVAAIIFAIQKSKFMESGGVEYTGLKLVGWVLGIPLFGVWPPFHFVFSLEALNCHGMIS